MGGNDHLTNNNSSQDCLAVDDEPDEPSIQEIEPLIFAKDGNVINSQKAALIGSVQTSFESLLNSKISHDTENAEKIMQKTMQKPTTIISPAQININPMTQSYEGKNSQNLLQNSSQELVSQPVMPDKPILVSKRDFLEQVLQKSHGSSFISDDVRGDSLS